MNKSLIEDIYDQEYDKYLDNLQNIVEDSCSWICSACGCECSPITVDDSFGYSYGAYESTHKDIYVVSDCCEAPIVNMRT